MFNRLRSNSKSIPTKEKKGGSNDSVNDEIDSERRHKEEKDLMQRQIDELRCHLPTASYSPKMGFLSRASSASMFRTLSNSSPTFQYDRSNDSATSVNAMDRLRSSSRSRASTINEDVPSELLISKEDIQLLGLIGKGSFGEVWRGLYKEEVVAVKVFISEESDVSSEVKMMAKASGQKNILELVGVVIQDDPNNDPQVAIVTKYMSNGSMFDMLVSADHGNFRGFSIDLTELINMATMASQGVMNLHVRGIIHRDLACRNLLVDAQMNVHVCDFGFARLRTKGLSKGFTATNLGPVRWEAPESLKNKEFSEKTDVFSFGVCLYEMFVGREPFLGSTNAAVAYKVLSGERMRIPINVDPVISTIITSCWAPNPDVRPNMRDVFKSLKERHHTIQNEQQELATEFEIIHMMKKGTMLQKVPFNSSTFTKGKNRYFKISDDFRRLTWQVAGTKRIRMGKAIEKRMSGAQGADGAPKAAFSIFTKDRSIDIICPSLEVMNEWVRGLNMLRNRFTMLPTATPSLRNSSLTMGGGGGPHVKMELNEAVKKYLENPSCYNTEEVLYLKRIVCARMGFGDYFLKFAHMGKPHERFFRLKRDLKSIFWTGGNQGNKAKFVSLLDVAEIRLMEDLPEDDTVNIKGLRIRSTLAVAAANTITDTANFNPKMSSLGFSLIDHEGERILNLISPNANLLQMWLFGLRTKSRELVDSERLQKQIKIMGEEKKEEGEGGEGGEGRRRGRGKRKVRGVVRMKSAMLSKMGLRRGSRKEGGE
ncbi:hypothetical protein TL16_g04297 [Triparma laevis f. inornata]|uniref:Protein kinase domain-containing protein n=1 Tax=Triparma laevis f. inornata TaxID=1714386 RepID=A0A9W7A9F7_9STRA|nr:hypothetical protein TL16_g04297 [Triparma laevis f. inornata]